MKPENLAIANDTHNVKESPKLYFSHAVGFYESPSKYYWTSELYLDHLKAF